MPGVGSLAIGDVTIPTAWFSGAAPVFQPTVLTNARALDRGAIRRQLPVAPSRVKWHLRVSTFDLTSPKELVATRLDQRGLRSAERSLLARSPGGSSNLGPSLQYVESAGFDGRRLLVVLSDFELFDRNPAEVLDELVASSADTVLALVFRSSPPAALIDTRVRVARIDPETSVPAQIAQRIVEAASAALAQRQMPERNENALIDVLDDESGSMWSGNDAFFLRHEAALIAVEHLSARRPPATRRRHR